MLVRSDARNDRVAPGRGLAFPACRGRQDHRRDDRRDSQAEQCGGGDERDQRSRIPVDWKVKPAKLRQEDRDARGTVKFTKAKPAEDGAKRVDLAIPVFGYKNHIGIDRIHGLIRRWRATHAVRQDGSAASKSRQRRVGRDRLQLGEERRASDQERIAQPDPSHGAEKQADAGGRLKSCGKIFHHLRSNVLVVLETPGSLRYGHPAFSNEPTASILHSRLCFRLCFCHLRLHETPKLGVQRNRQQLTVGLINA
jgi:hypothetical protein